MSTFVVLYKSGSKLLYSSVPMKDITDLEKAKKFAEAIYISQRDYNNTGNIKGVYGMTENAPKSGTIKEFVKLEIEDSGLIYHNGLPTYDEWLQGRNFVYALTGGKKKIQAKKTAPAKTKTAKNTTTTKKAVKKTK